MSQGEGGGRPSKYKAAHCKTAKQLAKLGATDFEIALFLDVAYSTFKLWCAQHPKFSAAIKLGKAPANRRAERSLYHRANGYTYEAEEIFLVDEVTERHNPEDPPHPIVTRTKKVLRVPVVKHIPPDTGALAFWLKNREKGKWRDKQDHEITGKGGRSIRLDLEGQDDLLGAYYARLAKIAADRRAPDPEPPRDRLEGSEDPDEAD